MLTPSVVGEIKINQISVDMCPLVFNLNLNGKEIDHVCIGSLISIKNLKIKDDKLYLHYDDLKSLLNSPYNSYFIHMVRVFTKNIITTKEETLAALVMMLVSRLNACKGATVFVKEYNNDRAEVLLEEVVDYVKKRTPDQVKSDAARVLKLFK